MSYPKRTIVSESFVDQFDMVEKSLIELQHQPSSVYTNNKRKHFTSRSKFGQTVPGGVTSGSFMQNPRPMVNVTNGLSNPREQPLTSQNHHHFDMRDSYIGETPDERSVPHYPMVFDPFAGDQSLGMNGLKQSTNIWGSNDKRVIGDATVWG